MKDISTLYFEQLRTTLGRLDESLSNIEELLLWIDEAGNIAWCNTNFSVFVNQMRIAVYGKQINTLFPIMLKGVEIPLLEVVKRVAVSAETEVVDYKSLNILKHMEVFARKITEKENDFYYIVVLRDVTEKAKLIDKLLKKDEKLSEISNFLDGVVKSISNILIVTTSDLKIKFVNNATLTILGYSESELLGQSLNKLVKNPSNGEMTFDIPSQLNQTHRIMNEKITLYTKTGKDIHVIFSATRLQNSHENSLDFVCVAQDISELSHAENEIAYLASHDPLTTLPNRSALLKILEAELANAQRQNKLVGLLFIDLDNFKNINDSLGHHVGDSVLVETAKRLQSSFRKTDILALPIDTGNFVGRLGGDEFVILLLGLDDVSDAGKFAERLAEIFSAPFQIGNFDLHITLSIGIAMFPYAGTTAQTLIKSADIAMYRAKENGRNTVEYYTEAFSEAFRKRVTLEHGLYRAMEMNSLYLVYQPQYNVNTNKIHGFEVLLRWNDPKNGNIPPSVFIPVAEKSGLIIPIGNWVIREACKQYVLWEKSGLNLNDVKMSINVSPYQLIKTSFIQTIREIVTETEINPHCLEFEITETALMTQLDRAENVLAELNNLGISIAIDDFGTGYSSLARIKALPIHTLKIDQSFIKQVTRDKDDAAIVRSIIALAGALELAIIAEGAETEEQIKYLAKNGCSYIQGFYFSKPLNENHMRDLLAHQSM